MNPLVLEVALDDIVVADAIDAYQDGRRFFLPLGQLAELLTLAIRTQPAQGTAEGFVLSEDRSFRLNVPQARAVIREAEQTFDPALVRMHPDDIYVESELLARWLPLDLYVDLSRLRLRVRPHEPLPLQSRLQRERSAARLPGRAGPDDPGFPAVETPYRLLGMPFIDQTFGLGLKTGNGGSETAASYTAFLTGDFLGLESSLYVSRRTVPSVSELRYTLGRHDLEGRLLGPMRARTFVFGSGVGMPSVPHVAGSTPVGGGHGITVSNRPLNQPTNFDRHTLEGDLPPGWDVELYYNDALIGLQRSGAEGRYRFEELPLSYGPNEFRLVFHGPLGQQRVERRSFLLDQASTPAGTLQYDLTAHRDDAGQVRSVGQVNWGVSKNLTAIAGWVRLPASPTRQAVDPGVYSKLGLRAFWRNMIGSTEWIRSPAGGWLSDSLLKTRIGPVAVDYSHLHLDGFSSEVFSSGGDPLRLRDKLRLQAIVPAGPLRLPVTLEAQRDQMESGRSDLLVGARASTYVRNTSITQELAWRDVAGAARGTAALTVSHRVADMGLSGQVAYTVHPHAQLDTVAVTGEKWLGEGYLLRAGVSRAVAARETLYSVSLNKSRGSYGLGLNATYSSRGEVVLGLQLFISMGREPREGRWHFDALPKADSGAASARVFLDDDGDGRFGAGEKPIPNAALTLNGSRLPVRTNEAGVAWLDRLPAQVPLDVAVDVQTLQDPFWQPQRKGVRMVARPGRVATLDFPVVLTSEIDGTIYLEEAGRKRSLANMTLELLDGAGKVVATGRSMTDGYFIIAGVTRGDYKLRISPDQLQQAGLATSEPRKVTIGPEGDFVTGIDFVLHKLP